MDHRIEKKEKHLCRRGGAEVSATDAGREACLLAHWGKASTTDAMKNGKGTPRFDIIESAWENQHRPK